MSGLSPARGTTRLSCLLRDAVAWIRRRLVTGTVQSATATRWAGHVLKFAASRVISVLALRGLWAATISIHVSPSLFRGVACHVSRSCPSFCHWVLVTGRLGSGSYVQAPGLFKLRSSNTPPANMDPNLFLYSPKNHS